MNDQMNSHGIGTREEWLAANAELLEREKELTRLGDQLARQRELLLLELAILSEQKMAKMIQLLEEARRDNPLIHNRVDHEADAMTRPADPQSVLDAIRETNVKAEPTGDVADRS